MGLNEGTVTKLRLLAIFALALALAGCGAKETPADQAVRDGILLVGNGTDPKTLDPHFLIGMPEANIVQAISEGLVVQDPDDSYEVRPGVAKSWSHNADYTRWTFYLRKDARWSDGTPLTAEDFVYSFRRMLTPGLGSEGADVFQIFRNAAAYNRGEIDDFGEVGVTMRDLHTLELVTEAPAPYLLPMLAGPGFVPVNREAVESGGGTIDRGNRWADAGSYVGNGPFLLSEWAVNRHVLVERNPQYWDADNVRLNGIRFIPIRDTADETQAFLAGRLHVTQAVSRDRIAALRKSHPESLMTDALLGANYFMFNTTRAPFDDARVRRALAMAIDRDRLIEEANLVTREAIGGMVPPGMPGYRAIPAPEPDLARARKLLAEAGFPGGKGFPAATILTNTLNIHRDVAMAICDMWKEGLGIEVTVREENWKDYLDSTLEGDFDIARTGWVVNYYDPIAFLDILGSDNVSNNTRWMDTRYDDLLAEARTTANRDEQIALLRQAERLLLTQQPLIPLYNQTQSYLVDERVKGWGHSVSGNHVYKFMSLAAN